MAVEKTADKNVIADHLERCSLSPIQNKYPSELSVGEKQRTAFICAIISKPEILLTGSATFDWKNS